MFTDIGFMDGSWIGQLSFALLITAMLVKQVLWMRICVMLAGMTGAIFAFMRVGDLTLAMWYLGLAIVCGAMVAAYFVAQGKVSFTSEEEGLRAAFLSGVNRSPARHLIDQGNWIDGKSGEVLTRENEAVSHLFYIENGGADVVFDGGQVGVVGPGELIGDATALSGDPASGTVTLHKNSRLWCISAPALRKYLKLHDDVRPAIERHINEALQKKLKAVNQKMAGK